MKCTCKSGVIPLITGEVKPDKNEVEVCTFRNCNQEPAEKKKAWFLGRLTLLAVVAAAVKEAKDKGKF